MYGNNYPNDYENQNVIDSTAKEVKSESGNFSGQDNGSYNVGGDNTGSSNGGSYNSIYGNTGSNYTGSSAGSTSGMSGNESSATAKNRNTNSGSGFQYGNYSSSYQTGNSTYGTMNGSSNGYQPNQGKKKEKKNKKVGGFFKKALVAVSLGLFFGICAGLGFYAVESAMQMLGGNEKIDVTERAAQDNADNLNNTAASTQEMKETEKNQADVIAEMGQAGTVVMDVSDVAAEVMPAIVSINNTYTQKMSYFGQTLESESTSAGSGIIVGESDTELLIVSNYHVVQDADVLSVQFVDGSEAEAQLKGSDPEMDLAVIAVSLDRVDAVTRDAIAVAALGDSDSLTVGEPAIAIGNALGYGQSVTVGVISALDRVIDLSSTGEVTTNTEGGETFIQTDAAINPGNSGGALLNMKGEVIGINSNKIGGSVVEGMGYAIPISAAKPIIEDLMLRETREKVTEENKGYLGISQLTVVDEMAEVYGMPRGVFVSQVYEGTGAAAAGIVRGNIITEFDGNKITSSEDLLRVMEYYSVGDTVEVVLMQGSPEGWESKTVTVTLGEKFE